MRVIIIFEYYIVGFFFIMKKIFLFVVFMWLVDCLVFLFLVFGKYNVLGKVFIWYWVCFDFYEFKIDLVLRMKVVGVKYFFNDYFG